MPGGARRLGNRRAPSVAKGGPAVGKPPLPAAAKGGSKDYSAVAKTVTVAPRPRAASMAARGWARSNSPK